MSGELERPEWGEFVVRKSDGSVRSPMEMSEIDSVVIFNCINCLLAVPLNLYVALVILLDSQLRNQPIYLIKLNTAVCNLLFILFSDVEEVAFYFWPNETLCHLFIAVFGLSNVFYLFNIFLSLVDQLVAIINPIWHNENVTPTFVIASFLILNSLLTLCLISLFVGSLIPLRCAYQLIQGEIVTAIWFILFFICVAMAIFILVNSEMDSTARESVVNLIPIFSINLPMLINTSSALICQNLYPGGGNATCGILFLIATYDNKVSSILALISPLTTVKLDQQFHRPSAKRLYNFLSTII